MDGARTDGETNGWMDDNDDIMDMHLTWTDIIVMILMVMMDGLDGLIDGWMD